MIVTRQKNLKDILNMLSGRKKIFIIGCGDCAATCKTGGEEEVKKMAEELSANSKEITATVVPDASCVTAQIKSMFAKNKKQISESDAVLVLACGSGVQCVKENDRIGLNILPGCDSLFAAVTDKDGAFKEVCSVCGNCQLDLTDGICPVTRCSKGILNGPCGGHINGKCEVDRNRDCAWILIYNKLKEKGELEKFKRRKPAKDYRKSAKPGALSL